MMRPHIQSASLAERRKALRVGVSVLQANHPRNTVQCVVFVAPNELQATASIDRDGVVRVVNRYTGALIAQSIPAPLAALDLQTFNEATSDGPPEWLNSSLAIEAVRELAADLQTPQFKAMSPAELSWLLNTWADQVAEQAG